jgi:hypothetical protein
LTPKIKLLLHGEILKAVIKLPNLIEDMLALSSDEYLQSIVEARKDYKEGRIKYLEDMLGVEIV